MLALLGLQESFCLAGWLQLAADSGPARAIFEDVVRLDRLLREAGWAPPFGAHHLDACARGHLDADTRWRASEAILDGVREVLARRPAAATLAWQAMRQLAGNASMAQPGTDFGGRRQDTCADPWLNTVAGLITLAVAVRGRGACPGPADTLALVGCERYGRTVCMIVDDGFLLAGARTEADTAGGVAFCNSLGQWLGPSGLAAFFENLPGTSLPGETDMLLVVARDAMGEWSDGAWRAHGPALLGALHAFTGRQWDAGDPQVARGVDFTLARAGALAAIIQAHLARIALESGGVGISRRRS